MKKTQEKINETYQRIFSYTPQTERLEDIQKQFFNLMRNTGVKSLKKSTGSLISSLIQLANESGWDVNDLIDENLKCIENRELQYKSLGRKKRICIYGGAFNMPHLGHIQVAQFVLSTSAYFDEIWLLPAYSHMYNKDMVDPEHRLKMCELAAKVDSRIKVFDYEIKNKLAGETYKLVKQLSCDKLYDDFDFSFIMGIDNANTFHKWVNYEHLEKMMKFVIVPRKGYDRDPNVDWYLQKPHIYLNDEDDDILEVSSTIIRNLIKNKEYTELSKYLNEEVIQYILENNLYV